MLQLRFCIFFIGLATVGFSQEEKPTELEEVLISGGNQNTLPLIHVSQRRIQNKLAPDVGAILALLPGLQIRTYGDVGGLKTAGFRSLGAAHSSVVVDFQNQPVTQSGSTDLSSIPTEFIRSISLIRQDGTNVSLPIQSKLAGSLIRISTLHQPDLRDSSRLSLGLQNGSFGYNAIDLATVLRIKRFQFTFTGKARNYEGNFPFEYRNANQNISSTRKNNGMSDAIGSASLTWFVTQYHTISVKGTLTEAKKDLAGAVVFYNETANQHLSTDEQNATVWHKFEKNKISWLTQLTAQNSGLTYLDSNYLNAQGYLKQEFKTHYLNAQSQFAFQLNKAVRLSIGSEIFKENIVAGSLNGKPVRYTVNEFLASKFSFSNHDLELQLGAQKLEDQRTTSTSNKWYILPALQYIYSFKKLASVGLIARYTVRQPTFSELYYQQIGNTNLKPEEAEILSIPAKFSWGKKSWFNSFRLEPFYTYNRNKIIAIPTKNLFVWSIQNIGISQSTGLEVFNESRIRFKHSSFGQTVSFTYQKAVDITDPNSVLYRKQLTYIPTTSGSVELDWTHSNWSVYTLFSAQGMRYALQENIAANEVPGFYTIDIGGSYQFRFKQHQLKLSGAIKNVTNQYNQYIRYFVLPGINYQIRLTYAI